MSLYLGDTRIWELSYKDKNITKDLTELEIDGKIVWKSCLKYSLQSDTTYSVAVNNEDGLPSNRLIIPSNFNNTSVTAIEQNGFKDAGITEISIPSGITSIYADAFTGSSLTGVSIPDSVAGIGKRAFKDCKSLTYAILEGGGTLYESAFSGCETLAAVSIGPLVDEIGANVFEGCTALKSIVVPTSITKIGSKVFKGCSNLSIYYEGSSIPSGWASDWNPEDRPVYCFSENKPEANSSAFWHYVGGVPTVWQTAESYFTFTLNDDETAYRVSANPAPDKNFADVDGEVLIPSWYNGKRVISIATEGFKKRTDITKVDIPDNITSVNMYAFQYCNKLTSVSISNNVKILGFNAFFYCNSLNNVRLGKSMTGIGEQAFCGCTGLTSIDIPNTVTAISDGAFQSTGLTSIDIPNTVVRIGNRAFSSCSKLGSASSNTVIIPDSVLYIDSTAFADNTALYNITIPYSVVELGTGVFKSCNHLKSITINAALSTVSKEFCSGCVSLENINIPASVTTIGEGAFTGCSYLETIMIPKDVIAMGSNVFDNCSRLSIYYKGQSIPSGWASDWNPDDRPVYYYSGNRPKYNGGAYWMTATDGSIFKWETEDKYFIFTLNDDTQTYSVRAVENINMPDIIFIPPWYKGKRVTSVETNGFVNIKNPGWVTRIDIPDNITSIGAGALSGYSALEYISLPFVGNKNITRNDDEYTFGYIFGKTPYEGGSATYQNKTNYYIPDTLRSVIITGGMPFEGRVLALEAFRGCKNLTNITILEGIFTSLRGSVFYGCAGLTNFAIPESITEIFTSAFMDCSSLADIVIPDRVTEIHNDVFNGCTSLVSLVVPEGVRKMDSRAVMNCPNLSIYYKGQAIPNSWQGDIGYGTLPSHWNPDNRPVYCYSENEPTENGAFWHWVDVVPTPWPRALTITIGRASFAQPGSGIMAEATVASISPAAVKEIIYGETLTYKVSGSHYGSGGGSLPRLKLKTTCTNATYTFTETDESGVYTLEISKAVGDVSISIEKA